MEWVDKLIIEYEQGRKELRQMHDKLGDTKADQADKSRINGMIADMTFALEWMEVGSEPDTFNGIDRRNAYQKIFLDDMDVFQSLDIEPEEPLTESERRFVVAHLAKLTPKERQAFILSKAYMWTQDDIAEELGMTRNAVKMALQRCNDKFSKK